MKQIFQLGNEAFFFLLLLFSSCTQDLVQPAPAMGDPVTVGFHISVAGIQPAGGVTPATRSDPARTEAEKALKSLWVLQFNGTVAGSTLIKKENIAAHVQNGFAEVTLLANNAKNRVYLVANADVSAFTENATTVQAFEAGILSFAPCTEAELAAKGLPMIASVDIDPRTDNPGTLVLQSLVTRLTLQCKVASGFACDIQSVTLNQVSEKVSVAPMTAGDAASRPATVVAADFTKSLEISGVDKTATMVCYFPENLTGRKTGLTEMWERTTANAPAEKAAYLQLTGKTSTGKICLFTFYLGDGSVTDFNVERNRNYKLSLTLESADDTDLRVESYVDLNPDGRTANCYLAYKSSESYSFDATVMGNGATTLAGSFPYSYDIVPRTLAPKSVKVLWETGSVAGNVVSKVQLSPDKTKVLFKTGTDAGNAVIAVYDNVNPDDASAKILWSWHIWKPETEVTDFPYQKYVDDTRVLKTADNYRMMDRDLGATVVTAGALDALGLYYQWGRKDPFPAAKARGSYPDFVETTPALANGGVLKYAVTLGTDVPVEDNVACLVYAVEHPTTFLKGSSSYKDWIKVRQDNLWGNPWEGNQPIYDNKIRNMSNVGHGSKSIYDPCPVGYRVPPRDTWTALLKGDGSSYNDAQSMWDSATSSWSSTVINPLGMAMLFPHSGRINADNVTLVYVGEQGGYWGSSPYNGLSGNGGGLNLLEGASPTPIGGGYRHGANPIRCVKELD